MDGHGIPDAAGAQTRQQRQAAAGPDRLGQGDYPNAVEVYISRLRGKLEPHGLALRSIRGFGYRLELPPRP